MSENMQQRVTAITVIDAWNQEHGIDLTFGQASDLADRLEAAALCASTQQNARAEPKVGATIPVASVVEALRPLFEAWAYQLRGHQDAPLSSIWQSDLVKPLTFEQYHSAKAVFVDLTPPVAGAVPDEVRAILAPFLAEAERLDPDYSRDTIGDSCQLWQVGGGAFARTRITYGDLRRVKSYLAQPQAGGQPAAFSSPPAPGEWQSSAGLKLIAREPSSTMMDAGLYQASHDATWDDVYSSWVDMWDAAPPAPSGSQAVPTPGGWLPIVLADKSIEHVVKVDDTLTLRHSETYWVRDDDGRTYKAAWSEGKRSYWWDWEAESPVDPVEFMPHPLERDRFLAAPPAASSSEG